MKETAMRDMQIGEMQSNTDRLNAFSDGVVAVIITLMVLELKAPSVSSFAALVPLWPDAVSYAISYLFVAIIWINHHHLMRFVMDSTPRLIWLNFLHLFLVALVPFATQWAAKTDLGPAAVSVYAGLFVCIDAAFLVFEREVMAQADCTAVPDSAKKHARRRSLTTLGIFAAASVAGYFVPILGMGLILAALSFFVRPEVPGMKLARPRRPVGMDLAEAHPDAGPNPMS
jgi:uncharacterized membrane protein